MRAKVSSKRLVRVYSYRRHPTYKTTIPTVMPAPN